MHCTENYSGLGIGDTNAKIIALMLTVRLRKFLENTNALSHSQSGFLPDLGTHEQVLTLTETARAATGGDREDPCICALPTFDHTPTAAVWKRCADIGIDGRFLTTLQATRRRWCSTLTVNCCRKLRWKQEFCKATLCDRCCLPPSLTSRRKDGAAAPFGHSIASCAPGRERHHEVYFSEMKRNTRIYGWPRSGRHQDLDCTHGVRRADGKVSPPHAVIYRQ